MPDPMPDFTGDVEDITTTDLLDAMYGEIQSLVERGDTKNVTFNYFLPPVPFGPELASFMDIGARPKGVDNKDESGELTFDIADLQRAAVNFAVLADYIPIIDRDPIVAADTAGPVDLNSLIISGKRVSDIYDTVLRNCKVVNNTMSDADREVIQKLEARLYETPAEVVPDEPDAEQLTEPSGFDDEDIDLEALLGEGSMDVGAFVEDPDQLRPPTRMMQLYQALEIRYYQVEGAALKEAAEISRNDPNRGRRIRAVQARITSARRQWEMQGRKKLVEAIMAEISVRSRGGMPEYLQKLQDRFEANQLTASVFSTDSPEEGGAGLLTEDAHYTALRPNGILNAPSLMKVRLHSSEMKNWQRTTQSKTSGGLKIPIFSFLGSGDGSKKNSTLEESFFKETFELSFEIVQGIIDRPWLDLAFLESPAYTTVDPKTGKALDAIHEIVTLSDGKLPPQDGLMPAIPMTVYFARDLTVRSAAMAKMTEDEKKAVSGKAGFSFLGFGARGEHDSSTQTPSYRERDSFGEITIKGQFLIGMASRYMPKSPDPDFDSHPDANDWV